MTGISDLDGGFRVGDWEVRPRLGTVARAGTINRVEPRVMAVLVCLARHAPDAVTREEFIREVWQGRVVTDEVLSRCISLLRAALDDQAKVPQCIQTLPRIGYRLVCPVAASGAQHPAALPEPPRGVPVAIVSATRRPKWTPLRRRGIHPVAIAAMCVIVALPFLAYDWWRPPPPKNPVPLRVTQASIAVLPFVDRSEGTENGYFADGLSEELIARLSHIKQLNVAASTSAFRFKQRSDDVRKIGEKLNVQFIVEGSVRHDGSRVRITSQLIDARTGYHLLSQTYAGDMSDIFGLQDAVAAGVVDGLARVLPGLTVPQRPPHPTSNAAAYELVLRARHQFRIREEAHVRRSIELFKQAILMDAGYAEPYVELARAQVVLPFYSTEDMDRCFAAALDNLGRAAAVDPQIGDASQDVVAFIEHSRWHWQAAQEAYSMALARRPNDSNLLQWYSQFLASVGHTKDSLQYAQRAKSIDVTSPVVNDRLAVAYMWNDRDDLAAAQFDVSRELGIRVAAQPQVYVLLLLRQRRYDEARALLRQLLPSDASGSDWLDAFIAASATPARQADAVHKLQQAEADGQVPLQVAVGLWMLLGEHDRALKGIRELVRDPRSFDEELLFTREARGVRQLPGFQQVLQAMGLIEYWDRNGWPDVCSRVGREIRCS